jgi:hypothetical protein
MRDIFFGAVAQAIAVPGIFLLTSRALDSLKASGPYQASEFSPHLLAKSTLALN